MFFLVILHKCGTLNKSNDMFWFILFIVVLIVSCLVTWHYAEHHELHKVRAEFEHRLVDLGPSSRFRQGLELAKHVVDEMDENFNGDYAENTSE